MGDIADVTKLAGFEFTEHIVYSDEGSIIALRGLNVKDGQLVLDDVKYIDGSNFSKLGRSKLYENDVLFTYVGTVGELAIVSENERFYLAPNVSRIRFQRGYDAQFMIQAMGSRTFYDNMIFPLIATSSQPALSMENIRKFIVSVPSDSAEQQEIGRYFLNLDNLITLHQYKLNMMFHEKNTFITYFWEQCKLGDEALEILAGGDVDKSRLVENGKYPVIANALTDDGIVGYYEDNFRVKAPAVTVTGRGDVGHAQARKVNFTPVVRLLSVTSNHDVDFLAEAINQNNVVLESTGVPQLTVPKLASYKLFFPPTIEEERKIGQYFLNLDHLITLHQRKIEYILKGSVYMDYFNKESSFEEAFIAQLQRNGWEKEVIKYPTEQDLIDNWANILYLNNKDQDRLDEYPLVKEEMDQILEQINNLRTPVELNGWINGKTISIIRKNPDDKNHFGTEVSLKIYDRNEIAGGSSRYQIVEQPIFNRNKKISHDRRGDIMLLINGMPVFHLELKRSHVDVMKAANQITEYAHEGVYTGIFSLVQVFFAITPEETLYFANPGPDGMFNKDFYFHWADFNNDPINNWKSIPSTVLAIPMAHELIGFYTVADQADGVLKVMRSYQYYASSKISNRVAKQDWDSGNQLGGYIWHTTGSGKTMTSFKSAQLIANSKAADKVVFLMDRIELGVQSLSEYKNFADKDQSVQGTENTNILISRLKSDNATDTLVVLYRR